MIKTLEMLVGKENILLQEPMSRHTTFQIGGPADYFVSPKTKDAFSALIRVCYEKDYPFMVLGEGSNLLVSDEGIEGLVISTSYLKNIQIKDDIIEAEAGLLLKDLSEFALLKGLSGLEFSCGIPGTLGGAVYMNAGAYEGEMKDVIVSVTLADEKGNIIEKSADEMGFSYRHSILSEKKLYCLSAKMRLMPKDKAEIKAKIDEFTQKREDKQPLDLPSAGSTFKRPVGYYAGKLIIEAGMQGERVGGAEISNKHAGFIVNQGGASARDVLLLIEKVKAAVYEKSGVLLEPEVRVTGRKMIV